LKKETLPKTYFLTKQLHPASMLGLLILASFLLGACGSGPPPDSGAEIAVEPTAVVVAISTSTVEPVLAPAPTPSALPTSDEAAEPATVATDSDSDASPPPESVPTAEVPTEICEMEPDLDFFGHPNYANLRELLGCALDGATFEPVAINEFGPGPTFDRFMLWNSIDKMIYILRPDNSWETRVDTWTDDQPQIACNPFNATFSSPPLPRRGFGKLWCEVDGLAEVMGLVEREERLCQHAVLQQFEHGQLLACFEDATYRYFRLMNDNSWETVFVQ